VAFEVEHDWQASLATPKPSIGKSAKTRLLLLLCFLWLTIGLVGHHPWKTDEPQTISAVKHLLDGGDWAVPSIAGITSLKYPPLYYLTAAGTAKLFSTWMPVHDAARLATGFWMALTLLMVGMTGREMWGIGEGRQTALIFLGSVGLLFSAHMLTPEVAGLAGYAMAFYGVTLSRRRPWRAAPLIGGGIGIAFLSTGPLATAIILTTAILLPLLFSNWRRKSYLTSLLTGLAIAIPLLAVWPYALWQRSPELLQTWLTSDRHLLDNADILYFSNTLSWYAWPALPLAAWSLWHYRSRLTHRPQFQLSLTFFAVALIMLGKGSESRDVMALPLLLPLAVMGGAAVDELRRGAATALNWFSIMLFGTLAFLLWLGWFAMMSGTPAKLAARMHKLSEAYVPSFEWMAFAAAIALSLIWGLTVFRAKRSNRGAVTDWAVGITMVWGLVMTLWLPWLDASKSYQSMFASMQAAMPKQHTCIASRNLGGAQRALLDYYMNIQPRRFETTQSLECDLYLVQDERKSKISDPGPQWNLIWEGKRPSDRRERYRLYQYVAR
jgi:4-amino-4-deoxy-L-arabinose transferase-like glycosyltransferase